MPCDRGPRRRGAIEGVDRRLLPAARVRSVSVGSRRAGQLPFWSERPEWHTRRGNEPRFAPCQLIRGSPHARHVRRRRPTELHEDQTGRRRARGDRHRGRPPPHRPALRPGHVRRVLQRPRPAGPRCAPRRRVGQPRRTDRTGDGAVRGIPERPAARRCGRGGRRELHAGVLDRCRQGRRHGRPRRSRAAQPRLGDARRDQPGGGRPTGRPPVRSVTGRGRQPSGRGLSRRPDPSGRQRHDRHAAGERGTSHAAADAGRPGSRTWRLCRGHAASAVECRRRRLAGSARRCHHGGLGQAPRGLPRSSSHRWANWPTTTCPPRSG